MCKAFNKAFLRRVGYKTTHEGRPTSERFNMLPIPEPEFDYQLPDEPEHPAIVADLLFIAKGLVIAVIIYATWRLAQAASEFVGSTAKTLQQKRVRVRHLFVWHDLFLNFFSQFAIPDRPDIAPNVASTPRTAAPGHSSSISKLASTISILVSLRLKKVSKVPLTGTGCRCFVASAKAS